MAEQPLTQETLDLFLKTYMGWHPYETEITIRGRTFQVLMCEKGRIASLKRLREMSLADLVERLQAMDPYKARQLMPDANVYR